MFKKILVANRGEIALRIMRTCKDLGIRTVAAFSELDRVSPFVCFADEAYPLQGRTSQESYLDMGKILDIARHSAADAIHPGYGFLSENAEFARKVASAGMIFIGPSAESMELMGNKTAARKLMSKHGVPVVPGTEAAISNPPEALETALNTGFPVLIKAAAGGGGKGMRLVSGEKDFLPALESARREALSAFGDDSVYIEKYLDEPRHIEFQILADTQGNTIHLGERECSIQRRHQKIIEESPSAVLNPELRRVMGEAAVRAAQACDYVNAGTIEFLLDTHRNFYFLEMNTRLQVEHPVTELVTGLDLVEEQIRIAAGKPLSLKKNPASFSGHAIECRLYAEDPAENFAPSPGLIRFLNTPDGPGIREDSGVVQGSEISLYYDPMISKLIAWGKNREQALQRIKRALVEYEISGIRTNIPYLLRILKHRDFMNGDFSTHFIERYQQELSAEDRDLSETAGVAAVVQFVESNRNAPRPEPRNESCLNQWKLIRRRQNMGTA